nr:MAG TPA: Per os infectivity factor [Caudoviricetes sp.]
MIYSILLLQQEYRVVAFILYFLLNLNRERVKLFLYYHLNNICLN